MKYRNNIQITADLLNAVQQCGMDGIKTTVLMQKGNLSHSRLQTFVYNLTSSGLLNEIKYDGSNL